MNDEKHLHDYLDGRMDAAARAEFEAAVAKDAQLADQVRAALEVRSALRAQPVALPEGFYERARARFESSHGAHGVRRRAVPWEAVGLAAATLLVAVLFWYPRSPEDVRTMSEPPATAEERTRAQDTREVAVLPEAPQRNEDALTARDETRSAVADARSAKEKKETAGGAAENEPASTAGIESLGEATAASALPSAERVDRVGATDDAAALAKVAAAPRPSSYALAPAGDLLARTIAIPATVLPLGSVQPIDSAQSPEWKALLASPARAQALRLAPDFSRERVVALGGRDPLTSCSGVSFHLDSAEAVIRLRPIQPEDGASQGGCLVVIPRGNQAIRIEPITLD